MARIGLAFETLKQTNPDLIMLSTCNMGQTGPRAHTPGFGSQLSALAGFSGLTGIAGGPPMLLYGPYIDFIAALEGVAVVLAALDRRRRTGEGTYIDVSQYESGLSFIAGALLDYHASGRAAERVGNLDPVAAPHGAYPCRDDQWLAVSCWSDDEFAGLAEIVGHPEWRDDARFAAAGRRRENTAILDQGIAEWSAPRDADQAASLLQAAGVHGYRVNTIADLFDDPQLGHRGTWRVRRHPVIGDQAYYFPGFDLSEVPGDVTAAGPLLGADNEIVYREFLGLSDEEYQTYESNGVF
jgi:crotonobetainyl-CoA:carnitine CoA-transferase CaiB-like acyl-CoA transferase